MKRIFLPVFLFFVASFELCAYNFSENHFSNNSEHVSFFLADIVTQDSFVIQTSDCTGEGWACIDIPFDDLGNYTFTDNGTTFTGNSIGCNEFTVSEYDYSVLFGQGMLGPYMLDNWEVDGTPYSGVFNNIPDLVDSMNLWDPTGLWVLDQTAQTINGGTTGYTYADMDVTVIAINAPSLIKYTGDAMYNGSSLAFSVGSHEVIVTDGMAQSDTFYVDVMCVTTDEITDEVTVGETEMYCFDHSQLVGQVSTVEIYCSPTNGTVSFQLVAGNTCVEYTGLSAGSDVGCFVICDNFGICDTTNITVTTISNSNIEWLNVETYPNASGTVCIDTSQLAGNVIGILNDCPMQSGEYVMFSVDASSYCVDYTGIDVGVDTACIFVIDDMGNVDTTYVVASAILPPTELIPRTLMVGESDTICLDTTQLGGNIVSIENFCADTISSENIFTLDSLNYCISMQANTVGTDSACVVLCDDFGVCDTTIIELSVIGTIPTGLIASDDSATTSKDESVTINVCENDNIPGNTLTNYYILPISSGGVGPNYGFATFNNDCTITYLPEGSDCDVEDTFNYVVCNTNGCDTALVTITVTCDEPPVAGGDLRFYNGFSPNGDDINPHFMIEGAEGYPNNTLFVYNRWGNQIYKANGYQNDWDGSWNGVTVQNGTYFYVFNDGEGNTFSGYIVIQR